MCAGRGCAGDWWLDHCSSALGRGKEFVKCLSAKLVLVLGLVLSKYLPNSWNVAGGGDKEGEKLDWGQTLAAMQQVELVISRTWIPSFCVPSITSKGTEGRSEESLVAVTYNIFIKSLC